MPVFVFLPALMMKKKEVDWKECFGSSRQYTMLMVKSQHEPMRFAARLASLFQRKFSFIADYAPDRTREDIAFATYFSVIDPVKNINMLVMANHTTVPASLSGSVQSPLLGLPLFDEYFYFFNYKGHNRLFACSQKNYDYLVFLYSDKDRNTEEVVGKLSSQSSFMVQDVTEFLYPDMQKRNDKKRISVLQNLVEYFAVMMNDLQDEMNRRMLGNKEIPMSNYVNKRYQIDLVITSPLLNREDI